MWDDIGMQPTFREIYTRLNNSVDAGRWWPATTRFEMMVGAVLVQHTAWRNVESSLALLEAKGLLDPRAMYDAEREDVIAAIRPSGFMTAKSRTCRELAAWVLRHTEVLVPEGADSKGNGVEYSLADAIAVLSDAQLREDLLGLAGVGPETADVIALYAFRRPAFIWDTYARSMLAALGYEVPDGYEQARMKLGHFVAEAGFSVEELGAFHGLIVESGKQARAAGGWEGLLGRCD